MLLYALACHANTDAPDTSADTDTDTDADTDADTDTDTDTDTSTLPASVNVSGTYAGEAFAFECTAGQPERLVRGWANAVGDIVGSFSCTDPVGALSVTFINPRPGKWTEPGDANFSYTDDSGGMLAYFEEKPTSWSLTFDTVTYVDVETMQLAGSLAGTWKGGNVTGTFDLQMACTNC